MVAMAPVTTLAKIKVMVRYILPFQRLVQVQIAIYYYFLNIFLMIWKFEFGFWYCSFYYGYLVLPKPSYHKRTLSLDLGGDSVWQTLNFPYCARLPIPWCLESITKIWIRSIAAIVFYSSITLYQMYHIIKMHILYRIWSELLIITILLEFQFVL